MLVRVAWYYYKENLTQDQIAAKLNISRNKIVRILEKVRTEGIVQFHIKGQTANCLEIEHEFKQRFQLKDAFIIPTPRENMSDSLAKAAAQYLEERLQPNDFIGFGWGDAVARTIQHLSINPDDNISVVTLTGGVNYYYFHNKYDQYDVKLDKFNGRLFVIPSPLLASTEEMCANILSEPAVKEILELGNIISYAVIGIGGLSSESTIIKEEKMTLNELAYIQKQNAVGDILGQFYDKNGTVLDLPHHRRIVGVQLDRLKNMQNVIGVAGGQHKIAAIFGALRGGYLDTLITDEQTALELLKQEVSE
ncbi:sugar-binding transcriptional regulator [Brevibacillus sp. B_LB10_24]|uniref:sugar-binding transcriptional regulator n=1 Tax=Brevibacillus sp. B_LB10_24 TaxID=3380645 RepID=UPI0038BB2B91